MHALQALLSCLPAPLVRIRLVWFRFLATLAFALVAVAPLHAILNRQLGRTVAGHRIERGDGFLESVWAHLHLNEAAAWNSFLTGAGALALLWLVFSYTVLSGGTFWVLAEPGRSSRLGEFLRGGGRLLGRFLRLLVLALLVLAGVAFLNRLLSEGITSLLRDGHHSSSLLGWTLHAKSALMLLVVGWLALVGGLAKAEMTRRDQGWAIPAFLRSLRLSLRHPLSTPILAAPVSTGPHAARIGVDRRCTSAWCSDSASCSRRSACTGRRRWFASTNRSTRRLLSRLPEPRNRGR